MHPGMIKGEMNKTTNLFILLILISFILPATAIRYAQAATENSQDSDSTGNEQQQNSSSTGSEQGSGSSNTGSGQESNNAGNEQQQSSSSTENSQQSNNAGNTQEMPGATSPSGSTTNNATSTGGPTTSNNTRNTGVDTNSILAVFNRVRNAAGVPPYVWNATVAAHAQAWVDYLAAGKAGWHSGPIPHCNQVPGYQQIPECSPDREAFSESLLAVGGRADPVDMIQGPWGWIQEKPTGHYLAMVSTDVKSVGCGFATSTKMTDAEGKPLWGGAVVSILGCRYR
jgi:uncharacterized protein YkwD